MYVHRIPTRWLSCLQRDGQESCVRTKTASFKPRQNPCLAVYQEVARNKYFEPDSGAIGGYWQYITAKASKRNNCFRMSSFSPAFVRGTTCKFIANRGWWRDVPSLVFDWPLVCHDDHRASQQRMRGQRTIAHRMFCHSARSKPYMHDMQHSPSPCTTQTVNSAALMRHHLKQPCQL